MDVEVLRSEQISSSTREELRRLWHRAFGEEFTDLDAAHAYGGVHVLARDGARLIGHASAIPRRIRFGTQPWRTVGYVEAVATHPDHQGQGVGTQVMGTLEAQIRQRWPLALLSTGSATGFYERRGWERWHGPTCTSTTDGVVPDREPQGIMIWRPDPPLVTDLSATLTCEDRPGDAW